MRRGDCGRGSGGAGHRGCRAVHQAALLRARPGGRHGEHRHALSNPNPNPNLNLNPNPNPNPKFDPNPNQVPDFRLRIRWRFGGLGPIGWAVKKYAPSDNYEVYTRLT